ncbi:MAG: hypothetical protein ACTHL8_05405 [Burkholderiaceae bacterium]
MITPPQPSSDALGRTRVVVIARKAAHGRLALRVLGMPPRPVTPPPADGRFTWDHWLFGFPPPHLVVDPHLQPEDVSGAQLVVLVEPRWPEGQLWVRVVGLEHVSRNGLLRRLREGAMVAAWQCSMRWPRRHRTTTGNHH